MKLRLYRNNKGSSLVMVIIVLAFVGILATVALWASLSNFQMKVTDKNVTNNFYSAEGVLDQIRVGLQNDAAEAMGTAYTNVMQQYAEYSDEDRDAKFASDYINTLRTNLSYSTSVSYNGATVEKDMLCRISKLQGYIGSALVSSGAVSLRNGTNDSPDYCFLSVKSNAVVIEDLVVEYTDDKGELSIIQTDLVLQVPDLNMVSSANAPQVFEYPIIGNAGVEFKGPGTTLIGSVYAGSQYALDTEATATDSDYYKSLVIADTSSVDFTEAPYVIADGDLCVNGTTGSAYTIETNPGGQVWARNISLTNATALLAGMTYVGDDMTLYGDGSQAKITGIYAGYNWKNKKSTEALTYSSAIILNGKNSVLDMSKAKSVVVAGYAYINTKAISTTNSTTTTNTTAVEGVDNSEINNDGNVQLGESIMVKGDQIAYLVPSECVATVGSEDGVAGKSRYKKNPLTVAEYKAVLNDSTCKLIDASVSTKTGKTLSEYFAEGTLEKDMYQPVLVPSKTGNPDEGLVYLYLKMDAETAGRYFMDYYNAGDEKLKKYNAFYTDGINAIGDDTTIYTAGTYVEYTEDTSSGTPLTLNYNKGTDNVNGTENLTTTYNALTTNLVSDVSQLPVLDYGTVFKNVIDLNYLKSFLSNCTGRTFTASQSGTGGEELFVVLTDNEGSAAYEFNDASDKHVYIIVATGDVNINTNFTGTVIANGKVTVGIASNITVQKTTIENTKKLLLTACESNSGEKANMYTFFREGSVYISNGFIGSESSSSTTSDEVSLSDLIVYQNWKKK